MTPENWSQLKTKPKNEPWE